MGTRRKVLMKARLQCQLLILITLVGCVPTSSLNSPIESTARSNSTDGQSLQSTSVNASSSSSSSTVTSSVTVSPVKAQQEGESRQERSFVTSPNDVPQAAPLTASHNDEAEPHEETMKKAINSSLHDLHNMNQEDLDQLVLSKLPEGSKLILRSVKIVRTDEDGNEVDSGEEMLDWNLIAQNGSTLHNDQTHVTPPTQSRELGDLVGASSHSEAQYDSKGSNLRTKEKDNKYYHNRDHGQLKKKTITATDGTKVKNYDGTEKGVTDFAKSHGDAQSNTGGRYKDSKKKNKGRKVTGFKRVYHKEEFQRTEHFYDDEEAKRIAESFGQKDEKEKSAHGVKDDDRKYHGTNKEHTDGHKVKNEHGTQNSYDKGHHETNKDSERHKAVQQHTHRQRTVPSANHRGRPRNYENHNYEGAYSNPGQNVLYRKPSAATPEEAASTATIDTTTPATAPSESLGDPNVGVPPKTIRKFPRKRPTKQHRQPQEQPVANVGTTGSGEGVRKPSFAMTAPYPAMSKPKKMKTFFSPRHRHYPFSSDDLTMAYAPNFAPPVLTPAPEKVHPASFSYSFRTIHPTSTAHSNLARNETKLGSSHHYTRYAGDFPADNMIDPVPNHYSTLKSTLPRKNLPARGNLISIEKSKALEYSGSSNNAESLPTSTGHYDQPVTNIIHTGQPQITHHYNPITSFANQPSYPSPRPYITWVPLGHSSSSHSNYPSQPASKYPPKSNAISSYFNPLRIGKNLIPSMFIRQPSTIRPMIGNNYHRPHRPSSRPHYQYPNGGSPAPQGSSSTAHYSRRQPQFAQFMNGLMDSVSGFFGRMRVG